MLPKLHRLTKGSDFKRVYSTGRSVNGKRLRIKFAPNGLPHTRVGVVVANSVSKRATQRNKIKRMVRATVQTSLAGLRAGVDMVISANTGAIHADYADLQQELTWLMDRAKLRT